MMNLWLSFSYLVCFWVTELEVHVLVGVEFIKVDLDLDLLPRLDLHQQQQELQHFVEYVPVLYTIYSKHILSWSGL